LGILMFDSWVWVGWCLKLWFDVCLKVD
jgi:hypothetical protein